MDFLQFKGKTILIFGVANKKSVAYFVSKTLLQFGAKLIYSVQNEAIRDHIQKIFIDAETYICDVEKMKQQDNDIIFGQIGVYVMEKLRSIDIDNRDDFILGEAICKLLQK